MNITLKESRILSCLYKNGCNKELKTMKRDAIHAQVKKEEETSIYTINNGLKKLIDLEMVGEGVKDGRTKMYFITEKGIEFIKPNH